MFQWEKWEYFTLMVSQGNQVDKKKSKSWDHSAEHFLCYVCILLLASALLSLCNWTRINKLFFNGRWTLGGITVTMDYIKRKLEVYWNQKDIYYLEKKILGKFGLWPENDLVNFKTVSYYILGLLVVTIPEVILRCSM